MPTLHTLSAPARFEDTVKKSRFLALAAPIQTAQDAQDFLAAQRQTDASHNCWAWRVGAAYRFADDGEPGGTAGRPILQAINGQQCDQVVVLVVRWFGGVKLGTGGLVRAYGGAAAQCLRLADKIALVHMARVDCACPFSELALVRSRLGGFDARIVHEDFDAQGVRWQIELPHARMAGFLESFQHWTRGQGRVN